MTIVLFLARVIGWLLLLLLLFLRNKDFHSSTLPLTKNRQIYFFVKIKISNYYQEIQ